MFALVYINEQYNLICLFTWSLKMDRMDLNRVHYVDVPGSSHLRYLQLSQIHHQIAWSSLNVLHFLHNCMLWTLWKNDCDDNKLLYGWRNAHNYVCNGRLPYPVLISYRWTLPRGPHVPALLIPALKPDQTCSGWEQSSRLHPWWWRS